MLEQLPNVLADRYGVNTEEMFSIMVRQAYMSRISDAICVVIMCILIVACVWSWRRLSAWIEGGCTEVVISVPVILSIVAALFAGWVLASIPMVMTAWLNPEAWALIRIAEMVK